MGVSTSSPVHDRLAVEPGLVQMGRAVLEEAEILVGGAVKNLG